MNISGMLVAFLVLALFTVTWFVLSFFFQEHINNPDGKATVTGNCGDTMEIAFRLEDGKVVRAHGWTDGCSVSKHCVDAAATLMLDKTVSELEKITMIDIMEPIGELPDTHLHCAQLAEVTLQRAVQDYKNKKSGKSEEQASLKSA